MASIARRLISHPLDLFHGDVFYPYGLTLAYSELLLPPALLGLPGFVWGNPILTYNLLLLALWPLNGLAMAWVAYAVTRSRPAAWLAGTVFCLSPYFTEYYLEFQMLLAALIPVALLAWVRWLESWEHRWLWATLAAFTAQALASWYYAVILVLALATLTGGFVCLRWRGWQWRRSVAMLAMGGAVAGVVLLPFAAPYLAVHRELGFRRGIDEVAMHYADLTTFLEAGRRSLLYRFELSNHVAETSAFVGFGVLGLAALSLLWLRRGSSEPTTVSVRRGILPVLAAALLGAGWLLAWQPRLTSPPSPTPFRDWALPLGPAVALGFVLLTLRGWADSRRGVPRRLGEADWVCLLLLLTVVFVILALGPFVHLQREPVGPGPYLVLYQVFPILHGIRTTTRFAVVAIAALGLLAALGLRAVEARLEHRPALRWGLVGLVFLVLALEYAVAPARYQRVAWNLRPVDEVLRAEPDDVAVLEWPTNRRATDADAMVRSLAHRRRLVNGVSGFITPAVRELADVLSRRGPVFPIPEAQAALRRIYPLRYLVVRLDDRAIGEEQRPAWHALRRDPPALLRFRGTFGKDDLYEIVALPEEGAELERWVSYDFVRGHPVVRVGIRPLVADPDLTQWVSLSFNDRAIRRIGLDGPTTTQTTLAPPFVRAAPNRITLRYGYRRRPSGDLRYRIGTTGAMSPGDLRVVSGGLPHGNVGSIQVNGTELSPNQRGYNLVALDAEGRVRDSTAFDTSGRRRAARELASWIQALPAGTIVAGAVRDEGSWVLTEDAVRALRTLGVGADLRGRYRESHAFVGVKDAPPGSALEAVGPRLIELAVGRMEVVPGRLGFELTTFELAAR